MKIILDLPVPDSTPPAYMSSSDKLDNEFTVRQAMEEEKHLVVSCLLHYWL